MPHRCDGARRVLCVLGAALMDGRHWQSAVQIVPTNRGIDEQEHLPQPNREEIIVLWFWLDKQDSVDEPPNGVR